MFPFHNMRRDHVILQSQGLTDYSDNLSLSSRGGFFMEGSSSKEVFVKRLKL